jgi:hypothetical protein
MSILALEDKAEKLAMWKPNLENAWMHDVCLR